MPTIAAQELFSVLLDAEYYGADYTALQLVSIANDTRKVTADSCFIAIKGETFDGHSAIQQVIQQGAKAIVLEQLPSNWQDYPEVTFVKVRSTFRAQAILANQFYDTPSQKLNLIAVTGTNGKTTTSSMISDLLMALGHKTGLVGTIHYKVDQTYYPAVNTTPNAFELQKLYADMVEAGCEDAIIEASSHALSLGRIWYSDVDCAIFTNLTREHLDFHKSMDNYAYAKSLLFAQLGQQFHRHKPRLAIVNQDDPYHEIMIQATAADVLTYSLKNPSATAYASDIRGEQGRLTFTLHFEQAEYLVSLPMLGEYNVANYLAAFLCLARYYGYSVEELLGATKQFEGVAGRMQSIDEGQTFTAIVDFAHTPDALERVLAELASHKKKRLIVLVGHSGGNRDSGARPEIGDLLFNYADEIVFTADNPRFEPIPKIVAELVGTHQEKPYTIIEDRESAIRYSVEQAEAEDVVLFAGKGGEAYQVIGDEYVPYNEVETVQQAIRQHIESTNSFTVSEEY